MNNRLAGLSVVGFGLLLLIMNLFGIKIDLLQFALGIVAAAFTMACGARILTQYKNRKEYLVTTITNLIGTAYLAWLAFNKFALAFAQPRGFEGGGTILKGPLLWPVVIVWIGGQLMRKDDGIGTFSFKFNRKQSSGKSGRTAKKSLDYGDVEEVKPKVLDSEYRYVQCDAAPTNLLLDLTETVLSPGSNKVDIQVSTGNIHLIIPDDVNVVVTGHVEAYEKVNVLGNSLRNGFGTELTHRHGDSRFKVTLNISVELANGDLLIESAPRPKTATV